MKEQADLDGVDVTGAVPGLGVGTPFVQHLGIRFVSHEGGHSELAFAPRPEHLNSYDVAHGGAVMTLLDVTMATAARTLQPTMGVVTVEMKTSFMRGAVGPLTAKGSVLHQTATLAFTQATVFDAKGKACAHATGTFKFVRALLPRPRKAQNNEENTA